MKRACFKVPIASSLMNTMNLNTANYETTNPMDGVSRVVVWLNNRLVANVTKSLEWRTFLKFNFKQMTKLSETF